MMRDPHWPSFKDIDCVPKKGILPRCLDYEDSLHSSNGIIVVGLNPRRVNRREMVFYYQKRL